MADNKNVSYLLIGSGQLAKHLHHWLRLLGCHVQTWNRSQAEDLLAEKIKTSEFILLAISDSAIADFYQTFLKISQAFDKNENQSYLKKVIHFSGALSFPETSLIGAHPLMTFGGPLQDLSFYNKIHFSVDQDVTLKDLFPKMTNSFTVIDPQKKAQYHALCVLGGNLFFAITQDLKTQIQELNIPAQAFAGYLHQSIDNSINGDWSSWSGPVARGDFQTQERNLAALEGTQLQKIYQFFQGHYSERRSL